MTRTLSERERQQKRESKARRKAGEAKRRPGPKPRYAVREDYATEADYQTARRYNGNATRYQATKAQVKTAVTQWKHDNPDCVKRYRQTTQQRRRDKVLALFGAKCNRCGFSDPRALQLDHIHGAKEPRGHPLRNGSELYQAILTGVKPMTEFQVLCANCNWIKRHENDECRRNRKSRND